MVSLRLFLILICLCLTTHAHGRQKLLIGGLFGIDTNRGGWNSAGIVPAAQMAIEDINNNTNILNDYELELVIKDAKCNIGESVKALVEYISVGDPKIMLLGPGCSKATMPVAEAAHYWNIIQIGFASATPLLSSKSTYPLYFRTNPSEHYSNLGRVAIVKRFSWQRVAILQMNNDVFTGISNSLANLLKQNNISIVTYESFIDHPRLAIENLKKKDARIIFGFFYIKELYMVFCEAYKQGLFGDKYVWILVSGRYEGKWWNVPRPPGVECTSEELRKGMSNVIGTGEMKLNPSDDPTLSGQTPSQLHSRYLKHVADSSYPANLFSSYGYDAVWTCALTLNASIPILKTMNLTLKDFNYTRSGMRKVFVDILKNMSFTGMTGKIRFDDNFDRITQLEITQLQGDSQKRVALYDMENNSYIDDTNTPYQWTGNYVPVDGLRITNKEQTISSWLFWSITGMSSLGIIFASVVLFFNIKNRNVRYIKMSSPNLNNVLIIGCILAYISGIISGLTNLDLSIICQAEKWMMTIAFTMGYGAMFSKTWRVHVIFLNSKKSTKRVMIHDRQLFGILGFLLLIDLVILLTWQIVDPLVEVRYELPLVISGDSAVLPFVRLCDCKKMLLWKAIMFCYQGLLLLFGAYLAWETRKVHIPALNDSKLIGMCVYNTVILLSVVLPVQTVLLTDLTTSFALTGFLTIFCTSFTLCVVFIPKMIFLRHNDGNDIQACTGNPAITSTKNSQHNTTHSVSRHKDQKEEMHAFQNSVDNIQDFSA